MKAHKIEYRLVGASGKTQYFIVYDGSDVRKAYLRHPGDAIGVGWDQLVGLIYPRQCTNPPKEVDNYPYNI